MKKVLGIILISLLYCSFGFAESTLPKCKDYSKSWNNKIDLNNARSKWTDCYGKYIKNWDKKFNFEFEGEYINGKANGAGQFTYKTKDGKIVNNGKRKAAAIELGISERTLYRKIKQHDLEL